MEQKEQLTTEEEKQNVEEEEYDEEDEEEKEANKEDNDKKNEEKDKENKEELQKENEKENINKEIKEEEQKDKKIEEKEPIEPKEEQKNEKEQISKITTEVNSQNIEEKVENIEKKEENNEDMDKKEIPQINKEDNNLLIDKKDNNDNKDNVNSNNNEEENKKEIKNKDENNKDEKNKILDKKENGEKNEEQEEEEEEKEEEIKDSVSTYILKYTRKSNEPRESSYDKELIKTKHCLFMIEFKILQGKKEKFLLIYCHEIAAIYFDEIYEKKYSLKDLYKENRHFRIFDDIEEAKKVVDEILNTNNSNPKKIFIDLQDNNFRLHLNITFFDKENEVIFNVPKKNINDKERIRLLPQFLKEIQIKMNHLEEDNKRLKNENKNMNEGDLLNSAGKMNLSGDGDNDFLGSKNDISQNIKKIKSGNGKGYKKKLIKK